MDVSRKTEIRVGLVSIVSLALLVGGIMLGKGLSLDPNTQTLLIRFSTSGGLENGSPVVVNGVKRGRVVSVAADNGSVLVKADVDNISDLHTDAFARVTILEITGGKKIEISPGEATTALDPKVEIPGTVAGDLSGLVTSVSEVSGSAVNLVRRLDTLSLVLTDLFRDGTVSADLKTMSSEGALLITDARQWLQQNGDPLSAAVRDLRDITSQLKGSIDKNEPKVSRIIDRADAVLISLESTLSKANGAVVGADSLIARINGVVQDIKSNKGLLNAVIYDESLTNKLDSTLITLRRVLKEFNKNGVNVNVGLGHR